MAQLHRTLITNCLIADAAYANLAVGMTQAEYTAALQASGGTVPEFTPAQAAEFAARYEIVAVINQAGTGLQATLFRDLQDSGRLVLSLRGYQLEELEDQDDAAFIGLGSLSEQTHALVAAFDALKASGTITSPVTVTGHSLGGYLAQFLTLARPADVSQTFTYNAPGFMYPVLEAQGYSPSSIPAGKITNVVASEGVTVTPASPPFGQVLGDPQSFFFVETGPVPISAHNTIRLIDSLQLYDILTDLSSGAALSKDAITAMLRAASNISGASLETMLDSLRKLFKASGASD